MSTKLRKSNGTFINADDIGSGGGGAEIIVASSTSSVSATFVGDGVNDGTVINTAIASLPSIGGTIILTDGIFIIDTTINLNKDSITLRGQGDATVLKIKDGSINMPGITVTNPNCTIKNLRIDGNYGTSSACHGIENSGNYCTIESVSMTRTSGINIEDFANYTTINRCVLLGGSSIYSSIDTNGSYVTVSNCLIQNTTKGGIHVYGSHSTVRNNLIIGCADHSIRISQAFGLVEGNYIYQAMVPNASQSAIHITSEDCAVKDNYIRITNAVTVPMYAIRFTSWGGSVSGNHIYFQSLAYAHIGISVTSGDFMVTGNFLINKSETPSSVGSIALNVDGINHVITGNYINAWDKGILMSTVNGVTVSGNFFYNTLWGIDTYGSDQCTINGNSIFGGLTAIGNTIDSYCKALAISGNVLSYQAEVCIDARSFMSCSITGNVIDANTKTFGDDNTYADILLWTGTTNYSMHNSITGNTFNDAAGSATSAYNIRENSANDGPNLVTGNVGKGAATANISTQHASTVSANNLSI